MMSARTLAWLRTPSAYAFYFYVPNIDRGRART